ncbi:MAG: hypothetical protein J6P72_03175 [Firmicutes bacterium]|nr:hypothetical protein [Bacillota bacterium]
MMANKHGFFRSLTSVICALLICGSLLTGCQSAAGTDIKSEYLDPGILSQTDYRTCQVQKGDFEIDYTIDSRMTYRHAQFMYWLHDGDHYDELFVQNEQVVKKGDVLASFEVDVSNADILEKELALTQAQASLQDVISSYEMQISGKQTQISALAGTAYQAGLAELSQLQADYAQSKSAASYRVQQAETALEEMKKRANENTLTAPFDGIIMYVSRNFRAGDTVSINEPVVVIAETASRAISFTNTNAFGHVPYMSQVNITDQKTKKEFTGTVISCADVTGEETDEVWVEVDQELKDEDLTGAIRLSGCILKKTNVLLIDSKALRQEGNRYYVLVLRGKTAVGKTYVKVGGINGGQAWIVEGLEEGQILVLEG